MKPDEDYVRGFLAAFAHICVTGEIGAYPAKLAGVDVIVLGRIVEGRSPGLRDSVPLAVIINDELVAKFDLTEARS